MVRQVTLRVAVAWVNVSVPDLLTRDSGMNGIKGLSNVYRSIMDLEIATVVNTLNQSEISRLAVCWNIIAIIATD